MIKAKGFVAAALLGLGLFGIQASAESSSASAGVHYCPEYGLPTLFEPMRH